MRKLLARVLRNLAEGLDAFPAGTASAVMLSRLEIHDEKAGYYDWDLAAGEIDADERWLGILGYSVGECKLDNEGLRNLVAVSDRQLMETRLLRAIAEQQQFMIEFRALHKDGSERWVRTIGSVVERDRSTGAPLRVQGAMQDISDLKSGLRERDEFLKFFQQSSLLMMISQPDGKVLKVNQATLDTFGYTEAEHYVMNFIDLVHPDDVERTIAEINTQMAQGHTMNFENRCRCKDGSYRWLSYRATYDSEAGLSYVTALDVTDRKLIEQTLHRQQERYAALVNNTVDVIMEFDREHRFTYVNDAVSRHMGFSPVDFIGKTHEEMGFPADFCGILDTAIEQVFLSGKPHFTGFNVENASGTIRIDWYGFPAFVVGDEVKSVFTVSRDITHSTKMEEELRRMQRLSSLGVLAGGIAHDFNNILTILFGNIGLARSMLKDEHPVQGILDRAEIAFQRATHLTGQLLTFAKGGEPVKEDVSIERLIRDVVHFDLSGSKVKAVFEVVPGLWRVKVDRGQISQVFSNLTTNALQAMPNGGHLTVRMSNVVLRTNEVPGLEAGNYLRFSVEDNGVGIEAENLEKIFDPYFTTKQSGSGLGLAMVHSILRRHGGHISVVSRKDAGTFFTVHLPASDTNAAPQPLPPESDPQSGVCHARILLLDDEDMIFQLCAAYLGERGFTLERARDGSEALRLYERARQAGCPFDCLIMDLTIPGGMSGKDALMEIRRQDKSVKAIVSSGYAADPVMANYGEYGFNGCMPKPFRLSALENEIKRVLSPVSVQ